MKTSRPASANSAPTSAANNSPFPIRMSLLADTPVPPECRALLHDLVDAVPQNELLTYAATGEAFLGGGFRKNNIAVVRSRIRQVLDAKEAVDAPLRRLLARHDPCASCLALLSEEFLKANRDHLEALFGRPALILALQLDGRLPQTCSDPLAGSRPPTCSDPLAGSRSALREALAPLLVALGAEGAQAAPAAAPATGAVRELRAELTRLKGVANRLEKEQANRAKTEAEAKKWQGRAEASDREIGPLRQRAEKAEAEAARLRREAARTAEAVLETRLAQEFAEWLGPRRAALVREAAGADPASGDPLLARAEEAFAKQAQADLAAGTRRALESRLAAYDNALSRCRSLISNALRPSDELLAVEKELEAEARRLRLLLNPEAETAPSASPEEALACAVNVAADHELPDLQHTVNRLHDLKIVTDDSRDRLNEQIRNRYAALYARRGGPGLVTGDVTSPEYLLRCALEGQTPLILLVDGHNALYALQSRYSRPQDHRGPSSEARDWLVKDLVQMFAGAHNCRVIVVFDGPERSEANPAGNVKVVFSGGGGIEVEHRADDVLVDEARFLHEADPSCRLLLATNDNGLASRASSFGARNLPPTALVAYFR